MQPNTEPHPVAGGQTRSEIRAPDGSIRLGEQVIDYEVWVDPQSGDAWVNVSPTPATFPLRLHAADVNLLQARVAERVAGSVQTVGVGVTNGTLLVAVRQEWPLVSMVLLGCLLTATIVLAAVVVRGRSRTARALALARHQATSREDERTRVAREIHDGPLQDLALLARTVRPDEQSRIREVSAELRALATDLRPPALDQLGLVSALSDLTDRWATAPTPLAVRLQADGIGRLQPELELTLYRVCQEALTNSASHGEARTAWVYLRGDHSDVSRRGAVDLVIRDDGKGLPKDVEASRKALIAGGHFGLAGMTERARAFGGVLSLGSGPGGLGAEVRLRIPPAAPRRRWPLDRFSARGVIPGQPSPQADPEVP